MQATRRSTESISGHTPKRIIEPFEGCMEFIDNNGCLQPSRIERIHGPLPRLVDQRQELLQAEKAGNQACASRFGRLGIGP